MKAETIFSSHLTETVNRIRRHKVVLLLQDTTTLRKKNAENHRIPLEKKESCRWIESYREAQKIASQAPATKVINVSDRKGDIYDLYHEAQFYAGSPSAYWLVRAKADRRLLNDADELRQEKLIQTVKNTLPVGYIEFDLPARNKEKARHIKQALCVSKVRLSPPDRKRKRTRYQIVETTVVIASEVDVPYDKRPVEWILLTNVPVENAVQAYEIIQWYLCRWQIEIYFRILKSGCKIEKLQLATKKRFDACLSLYMIVAWRILYLALLARECPEIPCNIVFSDEEWQIVYMMKFKQKLPKEPPSLNVMLKLIASFGGYLNRKSAKEPGPTTLWIGL